MVSERRRHQQLAVVLGLDLLLLLLLPPLLVSRVVLVGGIRVKNANERVRGDSPRGGEARRLDLERLPPI